MATATWNGHVVADSDETVMVEGNHYFPQSSLRMEFFVDNPKTSGCPWKGTAEYFDLVADGKTASAAAWIYRQPKSAAAEIKDHVAFWGEVTVTG